MPGNDANTRLLLNFETPSPWSDTAVGATQGAPPEEGQQAPPETGLRYTDLSDTPESYTGAAGKIVRVKADETGQEFVSTAALADLEGSDLLATGVAAGRILTADGADGASWEERHYPPASLDIADPDAADVFRWRAAGAEGLRLIELRALAVGGTVSFDLEKRDVDDPETSGDVLCSVSASAVETTVTTFAAELADGEALYYVASAVAGATRLVASLELAPAH